MLRIIVELVPDRRQDMRRELARAHISQLPALAGKFAYSVAVYANEDDNSMAGRSKWESRGMIANHDRNQTVWALVAKVAAWAAVEADKR